MVLTKETKSVICIVLAVISLCTGLLFFRRPGTFQKCNEMLDQNKEEVMMITGAVTGVSTVLSILPNDTATPVANKLADLSTYLMLILCILYLEQFLLPLLGFGTTAVVIPLCLIGFAIALRADKARLRAACVKILISVMVLNLVIPTSVLSSHYIRNNFSDTITGVIQTTLSVSETITSDETPAEGEALAEVIEEKLEESSEDNWLTSAWKSVTGAAEGAGETIRDAAQGVTDAITAAGTSAANVLKTVNHLLQYFIDSVAIMLVTSCLIPIITLFVFDRLLKLVFHLDIVDVAHSARHRGEQLCGKEKATKEKDEE